MSRDSDLIRLHEARTARQLADASFALFGEAMEHLAFFLILRPGEFELPSFTSEARMRKAFDLYIEGAHKHDLWLKRSPIGPHVRAVRHGDYTPLHVLRRSLFFKKTIGLIGCSYGASVVAWRDQSWLATLTVVRTFEQGDFTDADMKLLLDLQPHFESAVKRVAELHESKQGNNSLEVFIWGLPTAAIVLSWDLDVIHYNAAAQDLCRIWRYGRKARALKNKPTFTVPGEILARIQAAKKNIPEVRPARHNRPKIFPVINLQHPEIEGLAATVSFLPSRTLALTRGTFLVTLEQHEPIAREASSYRVLAKLSRREREIAQLAVQGLTSPQMARRLGTHPSTVRIQLHHIYRKLKIHSRFELIAMLQQLD